MAEPPPSAGQLLGWPRWPPAMFPSSPLISKCRGAASACLAGCEHFQLWGSGGLQGGGFGCPREGDGSGAGAAEPGPSQPCLARCPQGHFGAPGDGEGSASGNRLPLPGRREEEEEEDSPRGFEPFEPLLSSSCSTIDEPQHPRGSSSSQKPRKNKTPHPHEASQGTQTPRCVCPMLQFPIPAPSPVPVGFRRCGSRLPSLPACREIGFIPLEQLRWEQCHSRALARAIQRLPG